jgi:hypothetical protein
MLGAIGLWIALPVTGSLLLRIFSIEIKKLRFSSLTNVSLLTLIGMTIWSIPMAIAAGVGIFNGVVFGWIGWVVAILGLTTTPRGWTTLKNAIDEFHPDDWWLLAILSIVAFFYFAYPRESIVGGRDMGVYANHGIYIAHHGRLSVAYPWEGVNDTTLSPIFQSFPALYKAGPELTVQFAHLFPVWLAQAYSTFGFYGLIRFNAFLVVLFLPIFFEICRTLSSYRFALAATFFLALSPGQLWVGRVSLTEIFVQLAVWASILLFYRALVGSHRQLARVGGLLLGLTIWVRVDAFLFVPLLMLAHACYLIVEGEQSDEMQSVWLAFYQTSVPMFFFGALYDVAYSLPYVVDLLGQIGMINYFMIGSALLLLVVRQKQTLIQRFTMSKQIAVLLILVVTGLAVYAYFIRPHIEPYSIIHVAPGLPDNNLNNTRDYREDSLVNLGKYISPAAIGLALVGCLSTLWGMFSSRKYGSRSMMLLFWLGFSVVYLWNPSIAPDHYWWIRRFIPIVVPGTLLFCVIGLSAILSRLSHRLGFVLMIGVLIYMNIFLFQANAFLLVRSEHNGYYEQLKRIADKIPDNELVISDDASVWATWETPLYMAFDRRIIPTDIDGGLGRSVTREWIRKQITGGKKVYLAYEGTTPLRGLEISHQDNFQLSRTFAEPTVQPLPDSMLIEQRTVTLYEISDIVQNYLNTNLGAEKNFGVEEAGFYNQEKSGLTVRRWTNGAASLLVPLDGVHIPSGIHVDLESTGPAGTDLQILVNDVEVFHRRIPPGPWSKALPLEDIQFGRNAAIEINSGTFTPGENGRSSDVRSLGVAVRDVRLLEHYRLMSGSPLPNHGFRSEINFNLLRVEGANVPRVSLASRITVQNTSDVSWPTPADIDGFTGSVRVGIRWYDSGKPEVPLVEQRVDLPHALFPGESIEFSADIPTLDSKGRKFKSGSYILWVGLVQEGVAWFYQRGGIVLKRNVYIK